MCLDAQLRAACILHPGEQFVHDWMHTCACFQWHLSEGGLQVVLHTEEQKLVFIPTILGILDCAKSVQYVPFGIFDV